MTYAERSWRGTELLTGKTYVGDQARHCADREDHLRDKRRLAERRAREARTPRYMERV